MKRLLKMKTTINNRKRYLLVADLQNFATPYASLYTTDDEKSLYVFVRTSDYKESGVEGIMAQVTVAIVQSYISGKRGLKELIQAGKPRLCDINPSYGTLNWSVPCKYIDHKMASHPDYFDEDFCIEQGRLSYFLKQYK